MQREVARIEERTHVFDQRAVISEVVPFGQQKHRSRGLFQRFGNRAEPIGGYVHISGGCPKPGLFHGFQNGTVDKTPRTFDYST